MRAVRIIAEQGGAAFVAAVCNKPKGFLAYLRDKDWEERDRVGRDALIKHGVLKP